MPKREKTPAGAPIWVDLPTSDPDKAAKFYGDIFGWTVEADPNPEQTGGYATFQKDGNNVGGCMRNQNGMSPVDVWTIYLKSDDARATVKSAVANGGQVISEPMDVLDYGTMAVLTDAGGAQVGIWQPGTHTGFDIVAEHGAPSWWELHTRDYEKSLEFYKSVFGWTVTTAEDSPALRYSVLEIGGEQFAGVMDSSGFLPEGVPAHWTVYFGTDDADKSVEQVKELGGTVFQPPEDTPYGRLAHVADSTGAQFRLIKGNV
jgi:predicted enzyme related to lactoylglutathione lyase